MPVEIKYMDNKLMSNRMYITFEIKIKIVENKSFLHTLKILKFKYIFVEIIQMNNTEKQIKLLYYVSSE
jgi:hypothetical protein